MVSAAEAAARFGIAPESLETLIEHPRVAELIFVARSHPEMSEMDILKSISELPLLQSTEGGEIRLDIGRLQSELSAFQDIEARGDGRQGAAGERAISYPMLQGTLERYRAQADRRLRLMMAIYDTLDNPPNGSIGIDDLRLIHDTIKGELEQSGVTL